MPLTNLKKGPYNLPHNVQDMGPPVPLIYSKNIANYSAFNNVLTDIINSNGIICRSTSSYIIVQPEGHQIFNAIIKL